MEIWKDIEGYEGLYQVSNQGNVKSLKRKYVLADKILIPRIDTDGYALVNLSKHNKKTTFKIHRLVAETFIPNPDNLPEINHKDENKLNNKADNLEWCDRKYNNTYGTRQNLYKVLPQNKKNNTYTSKAIQCIETGIIYPSISEAQRQIKCRINLKQKTSGGYHWKYINKEEL